MAVARYSSDFYVISSNEALELKLVRRCEDLEDDATTFKPEMTHQVFGDSETIFGYRDLKIKLYYAAASLMTYLGISFSEKVNTDKFDGVEADDVMKQMSKFLQEGYEINLDEFSSALSKDANFLPFGELLHKLTVEGKDGNSSTTYEVYYCDIKFPGFASYHERLQTFILWYIDAASFIDVDDDRWRFFILYERYKNDGLTRYAVAGYSTVYEYYAYPFNIRPRIGQILVLPPFQHQGLGCELLKAIYSHYVPREDVVDITVENPSEEFQRIRDFVDVKNCADLVHSNSDILRESYGKSIEANFAKLKLSKKQMRRVYEILRLQFTNVEDENAYKKYRLDVKKRLNIPYQREQADLKKLERVLNVQEYQATVSFVSTDLRMENLDREYRELESQYRHILERLSLQ